MSTTAITRTLNFSDPARFRELAGELSGNLKVISERLGVSIGQRGDQLMLEGSELQVERAVSLLTQLDQLVGRGLVIRAGVIEHACRLVQSDATVSLSELFDQVVLIGNRRRPIYPRTPTQQRYVQAMKEHDVVFGIGPAGTGKTYLAMAMAVAALRDNRVDRIVLCRPAVEAGEKLGFLPGDLSEKVSPYLRPLYDALGDMMDINKSARLIERGTIEVAPLAFMRGRTLSDAFVILDEAQNTTTEQMKMFLTRLGFGSKAVITGDVTQVDLPENRRSGLIQARRVLADIPRIAFCTFDHRDVVRHGLVSEIIRAYDRHRGLPAGSGPGGAS